MFNPPDSAADHNSPQPVSVIKEVLAKKKTTAAAVVKQPLFPKADSRLSKEGKSKTAKLKTQATYQKPVKKIDMEDIEMAKRQLQQLALDSNVASADEDYSCLL